LNQDRSEIKDKISSFDDQKPDKMKKNSNLGNVPQDEEELNKMID